MFVTESEDTMIREERDTQIKGAQQLNSIHFHYLVKCLASLEHRWASVLRLCFNVYLAALQHVHAGTSYPNTWK